MTDTETITEVDLSSNGEKKPKRILHFSDGTLAEYSSDDENETQKQPIHHVNINESSLGWTQWLQFKTHSAGTTAVEICDYLGDCLANFFGITTPKYQFEIDHFNSLKKIENDSSDVELGVTFTKNVA